MSSRGARIKNGHVTTTEFSSVREIEGAKVLVGTGTQHGLPDYSHKPNSIYIKENRNGSFRELREYDKTGFPIIEIGAKYLNPAKFDDELELETISVALTKAKMEFNYKIRKVGDEKILVEGFSRNVFTDSATGKITRLPDKYFSKLQAANNNSKE